MNKEIILPSRYWEPGAEDANENILPESEWIPEDEELPFE